MSPSKPVYAPLHATAWPQLYDLWQGQMHLVLRGDDNQEGFERLLRQSPGLSFGAWLEDRLVGSVLAGYDGRRGYLYHMAVADPWRRQGIGSSLAHHALIALRGAGAERVHLLVEPDNAIGMSFWRTAGFQMRTDVKLMTLEAC